MAKMTDWVEGPPEKDRRGYYPAGALLEMSDGGVILVGHINERHGLCDDCQWEEDVTHVVRHQIIWAES